MFARAGSCSNHRYHGYDTNSIFNLICTWAVVQTETILWIISKTRKPVVTWMKVILFFMYLWWSDFIASKNIRHNWRYSRIKYKTRQAQRNYHKIDQNGARKSLHVQVRVSILVTMVTMQLPSFYLICTWAVVQYTNRQKESFEL